MGTFCAEEMTDGEWGWSGGRVFDHRFIGEVVTQ